MDTYNLNHDSAVSQYLNAFYFSTVTMISVGYGDIVPQSNSDINFRWIGEDMHHPVYDDYLHIIVIHGQHCWLDIFINQFINGKYIWKNTNNQQIYEQKEHKFLFVILVIVEFIIGFENTLKFIVVNKWRKKMIKRKNW